MKKFSFLLCLAVILCFGINDALSQGKCVNTEAEAVIINNDIPSAKLEAIARAKWSAIEQVVGTEIKAQSFVQNFTLVENAIKTKAGGVVKRYMLSVHDVVAFNNILRRDARKALNITS